MKKAVIYPGRFQPMLPHHEIVYKKLQAEFPDADVYIATSDKVEGSKSPFNFKEKAEIMSQMFDIPIDKIILAPQPYLIDSYKTKLDMENTMVIFAVGEKDTDRFPMNNVDEKTGLDMTVRGETRPKYYQMINTLKQHPALPMSERGYIHIAPTVKGGDEVASASAFRKAFTSVEDVEKRKDIFQQYLGSYNEKVFKLFNNKLIGEQMSEMIDVMKYLAGLSEAAPVQYGDLDVDTGMTDGDEDEYATKPGYEQDSMINQLGKVIDSEEAGKDAEDMKIKNFKPVTSVKTDDGKEVKVSPAQAKALKKMMDMLPSNRGGEEQSPREKFLDAIQNSEGLENMLDFAKSKGLVKETSELPQVDLSDIRADYTVEEELEEGKLKDVIIDAMEMSKEEFDAEYKGSYDYDEINKTYNEEHPEYVPSDAYESAPFGEPSREDQMYQDLMDAYEKGGEEELAKEMKMSMEELDDELNDISLETGLHMDDDRDEIVQKYVEDVVNNADYKDHGEPDYEMAEMRKLAGLEEKYQYANTEEKLQDMIDTHQYIIDNNHPEEVNVQDHEDAIDWYEGLLDQHRKTGEDKFEAPQGGDTAWREMIWQEMEDIDLYKPHGKGDLRGVDNLPEDEEMAEMRKLAGLPERAINDDDFKKTFSDEEIEKYKKREADPDSLTGSPLKVLKNLVKQEIGNKKFGFRKRK